MDMNLTTSEKYNILRRSCNTLIKKNRESPLKKIKNRERGHTQQEKKRYDINKLIYIQR